MEQKDMLQSKSESLAQAWTGKDALLPVDLGQIPAVLGARVCVCVCVLLQLLCVFLSLVLFHRCVEKDFELLMCQKKQLQKILNRSKPHVCVCVCCCNFCVFLNYRVIPYMC